MYGSINDADIYFTEQRLNSELWFESTINNKTAALNQATRKIDMLNYWGIKSITNQSNEFPRNGDTIVPKEIIWATYELAFALLDGLDSEFEIDKLRVTSQGYTSVRTTYDSNAIDIAKRHGIVSYEAWNLLKPFLADIRVLSLRRG